MNFGVPLTPDGKTNWLVLQEKLRLFLKKYSKEMNKQIHEIEKMIQRLRIECQQIITKQTTSGKMADNLENNDTKIEEEDDPDADADGEKIRSAEKDQEKEDKGGKKLLSMEEEEDDEEDGEEGDDKKISGKNDGDTMSSYFKITYDEAFKFTKNENMLHFIRKTILQSNGDAFRKGLEDFKDRAKEIDEDHPAFISDSYVPEEHDL